MYPALLRELAIEPGVFTEPRSTLTVLPLRPQISWDGVNWMDLDLDEPPPAEEIPAEVPAR